MKTNETDILHNGGLDGLENYKVFKRRYPQKISLPVRNLSDWYLQESLDKNGHFNGVCLVGTHNNSIIRTSTVTSIISLTKVCTYNCTYVLEMPSKVLEHACRGIEKFFVHGFPSNWKNLIENAISNVEEQKLTINTENSGFDEKTVKCIVGDEQEKKKTDFDEKFFRRSLNSGKTMDCSDNTLLSENKELKNDKLSAELFSFNRDELSECISKNDDIEEKAEVDVHETEKLVNENVSCNKDNDIHCSIELSARVTDQAKSTENEINRKDSKNLIADLHELFNKSKSNIIEDSDTSEDHMLVDDSSMKVIKKQDKEPIKNNVKPRKTLSVEEYVNKNSPFKVKNTRETAPKDVIIQRLSLDEKSIMKTKPIHINESMEEKAQKSFDKAFDDFSVFKANKEAQISVAKSNTTLNNDFNVEASFTKIDPSLFSCTRDLIENKVENDSMSKSMLDLTFTKTDNCINSRFSMKELLDDTKIEDCVTCKVDVIVDDCDKVPNKRISDIKNEDTQKPLEMNCKKEETDNTCLNGGNETIEKQESKKVSNNSEIKEQDYLLVLNQSCETEKVNIEINEDRTEEQNKRRKLEECENNESVDLSLKKSKLSDDTFNDLLEKTLLNKPEPENLPVKRKPSIKLSLRKDDGADLPTLSSVSISVKKDNEVEDYKSEVVIKTEADSEKSVQLSNEFDENEESLSNLEELSNVHIAQSINESAKTLMPVKIVSSLEPKDSNLSIKASAVVKKKKNGLTMPKRLKGMPKKPFKK